MADKMKIKKGDLVQVLTGKDKSKQGKVIAVYPEHPARAGRGRQPRDPPHQGRPEPAAPTGGLVVQEAPIHVSNVAVVDPSESRPGSRPASRPSSATAAKATRTRVAVRSGKDL